MAYSHTSSGIQSKFRRSAEHNGIELDLIGDWADLAAYYAGADGNAWSFSAATGRFSCCGELAEFLAAFAQRYRGRLFDPAT